MEMAISKPKWLCNGRKESFIDRYSSMKENMDQEKLKEILFYAHRLGNEKADIKLTSLIEEIRKQFEEDYQIKKDLWK